MPALFKVDLLMPDRTLHSCCLRFLWLLLALAGSGAAQAATTYYVRTDGGTASQCTGTTDAAYPGSGSAQACAWSSPHVALPASGAARIAGGDTLLIGPGSYMIGWGAPGAAGGRCYSGGRYDCYLAPLPSGPSASAKTRLLGNCATPPKLWGTERVSTVLNLEGSSNVEVGCLEITDQSDCVELHSNAAARCQRDTPPYGAWASVGLTARASANVWLHDLNIHGLASRGILAGGLSNWTVDRVKLVANGWAGWDGDIGSGSSNSGPMLLRNVEIGWNGCGQRAATGVAWACWAQQAGGYGDGLGTAATGGQWVIEDAFIHNNTSDGLDLLYLDGAASTSVVVRRAYAVGNAGNQIKTNGAATIENSVVVGSCASFSGKDDMQPGDQCRAMGNALSIGLVAGQTATVRQNTITGQGDCLILTSGGSASSRVYLQNNALLGQPDFTAGGSELACGHYADNSSAVVTFTGNAFWNVKAGQCPAGSTCGQDPKLTNPSLASFDATPLAGSPLVDKVALLSGMVNDFYLAPRPSGAAVDIGAVEVQPAVPVNDFNGDGKSDILWRNTISGANMSWLAANAATAQILASLGDQAWKVVGVGDFNGDGKSDILWRNSSTGANTLWMSGNAATRQALSGLTNPTWAIVGVGDFNGDGKSDILWRNSSTGANTIWQSGSFSSRQVLTGVTDQAWKVVGVGDFNGDGRSDILWRNSSTGANTIWKSANSTDLQSMPGVTVQWSVAGVGDFDADGRSDILWRNTSTGANTIWKSGQYSTQQAVAAVTNQTWKITIGDFDDDGRSDILWHNPGTGANTIWESARSATRQSVATLAGAAWTIASP